MQAQKLLSAYSSALDALAAALVKRGLLSGRSAHQLIWQTTGYPDADWRFQALGLTEEKRLSCLPSKSSLICSLTISPLLSVKEIRSFIENHRKEWLATACLEGRFPQKLILIL